MRIATWNVNSIKQRLEHLLTFLKSAEPDVVCLQELKCVDDAFPRAEVEAAGYNVATLGQKAYNGVAILSKRPLEDVRRGLPGDEADDHARYIEAVVPAPSGIVRVASIYLPNGNPVATPKFAYKLAWLDRLRAHARDLLRLEEPLVLARRLQRHPRAGRRRRSRRLGRRCPLPAGEPGAVPPADQSRPHRRRPRLQRRRRPLHVLGLSGRRVPTQQRHPHRPSSALAAGRRPAALGGDPQGDAKLGQAVGPRPGDDRP